VSHPFGVTHPTTILNAPNNEGLVIMCHFTLSFRIEKFDLTVQ
jgi:hypothetical protein